MRASVAALSLAVVATSGLVGSGDFTAGWQHLAPGMELRILKAKKTSPVGDSQITVVRFDPERWEMEFLCVSRTGGSRGHTAREWCERHQLTAAINAGMFNHDYKTHTGYLRSREHINNSHVNNYQSVAAFDPTKSGQLPPFRIFDLDEPNITMEDILRDYMSVVQNLRLIKRPGLNRWKQQSRMWSEAALGEDVEERVLLIFSRSPFTMHDLNQELLSAGISIVAAQHLEGGPEAQLYLQIGNVEIDLFGSYETSFREDDNNAKAWPVPNILGIRPRVAGG